VNHLPGPNAVHHNDVANLYVAGFHNLVAVQSV
jgi:hypothetical protein